MPGAEGAAGVGCRFDDLGWMRRQRAGVVADSIGDADPCAYCDRVANAGPFGNPESLADVDAVSCN